MMITKVLSSLCRLPFSGACVVNGILRRHHPDSSVYVDQNGNLLLNGHIFVSRIKFNVVYVRSFIDY